MKKLYTIIAAALLTVSVTAQNARIANPRTAGKALPTATIHQSSLQAAGDTLMFMPLLGYYVTPVDSQAFDIQTEDLDQLVTSYDDPQFTWEDFTIFYTTDPWHMFSWDTDTANYYWAATSWFTSPNTADNWLEFGPLTIPAGGATLSWDVKSNPYGRDGFEILLSTTGMSNYTDFIDPAIYTRPDFVQPATGNNNAIDTMWQTVSVNVPASYNGQQVYFAFHHIADDIDVLYFDNILVTEANATSANELTGVSFLSNYPNPAKNSTVVTYSLKETADVSLKVTDVTGKTVSTIAFGDQASGTHNYNMDLSSLDAGVYFYTLTAGDNQLTRKLMVTK